MVLQISAMLDCFYRPGFAFADKTWTSPMWNWVHIAMKQDILNVGHYMAKVHKAFLRRGQTLMRVKLPSSTPQTINQS